MNNKVTLWPLNESLKHFNELNACFKNADLKIKSLQILIDKGDCLKVLS